MSVFRFLFIYFYLFYIVQYKDFTLSNNCYYPKICVTNSAIYLGHFLNITFSLFLTIHQIDSPPILIHNYSKGNNFESRMTGSTLRSKDRYLCNALPKNRTEVLPFGEDHDEFAVHLSDHLYPKLDQY